MKVIDAVWEKRNLGIDACEVLFEREDAVADISSEFERISAPYTVVKVPSERNDISEYVQKNGYRYIEDLIGMEHDLHDQVRHPLHQRLYEAVAYRSMTEEDYAVLQHEIQSGIFDSDRISKDLKFGKSISAVRYCNWVADLREQGAALYTMLYRQEPSGFIILLTKDGSCYQSVLGGAYRRYLKTGLGMVQKEQEIVKKLGGKKLTTNVSSNNPSQLKALVANGYVPVTVQHVFVKHN